MINMGTMLQMLLNLIRLSLTTYREITISSSVVIALIIIYISGLRRRSYNVLYHDDTVMIGNIPKTVEKIAEEYQPILHYREGLRGFEPSAMHYEAVDMGPTLVINYFTFWRDEIHPVFLIHLTYRIVRFIRYGSCADIEFIQITINKRDGKIQKICFETVACPTPQPKFPKHIMVHIKSKNENGKYELYLGGCKQGEVCPIVDKNRVHLSVISWNHCYSCWSSGDEKIFTNIPLKYIDEDWYIKYRIARRSNPKDLF